MDVNPAAETVEQADLSQLLALPPMFDYDVPAIWRAPEPFTTVPDRPRSGVITYTVQQGDTIYSIAERFGLQPDTIFWANPDKLPDVHMLRVGLELYILPVDGVYHTVVGNQTIQDIANRYGVDPYAIIDCDYNDLRDMTPESVLEDGTRVVVPGGEGERADWTWTPPVYREAPSSGTGSSNAGMISFAPGEPGSCGWVRNEWGRGVFDLPMAPGSYTITRGFAWWHTGIDMAAPEGTPVYAADSGVVIFAGWNSWGYGYSIVISHGVWTTLYGHLSRIYVRCGQHVNAGQAIGAVGSTGNSSGPHLHFETRYNDVPQDPTLAGLSF